MPERLTSVRHLDFGPRGPVFPSPTDWRDQFIYQLMLDRFQDNNLDRPAYDPKTDKRGRDKNQGALFQGGTLKGVTRRLDYIQKLGCTAVWITPPFKQRQDDPSSYHGYGIQDFLNIDPRFGTTEDLCELTREAHERGIYVILDIVINHTADCFRYAGEGPHPFKGDGGTYDFGEWHKISKGSEIGPDDAIWPVELQNPDCFNRRGSIGDMSKAGDDEMINGDFFSFKDLNLGNPAAADAMIQAFKHWIAVADIDGYRMDTVKHVPPEYMAVFCNAIHEYARRIGKTNFIIFGEIVGDDAILRQYIGANIPIGGITATEAKYPLFDAALDYPLYSVLDEVIKGTRRGDELWNRYGEFKKYYRSFGEAAKYYITFVDNHDQPSRPWRRFLNNANDDRLAMLAMTFVLCNLGIPCIYSGTEQGFDGGGDSDVYIREAMFGGQWGAFDTTGVQFFNPAHPLYKAIAAVAKIRARQPALRYGREYFREISGNGEHFSFPENGKATLAFSRVLDTDEVLVALNLDTEERNDFVLVDPILSSPGAQMADLLNGGPPHPVVKTPDGRAAVQIKLAPRTMAILKSG